MLERDWHSELRFLLNRYSLDGGELNTELDDFVLDVRQDAREEGWREGGGQCASHHGCCS